MDEHEMFELWKTRDHSLARKRTVKRDNGDFDFWYYPDLYIGRIDHSLGHVWLHQYEIDTIMEVFKG